MTSSMFGINDTRHLLKYIALSGLNPHSAYSVGLCPTLKNNIPSGFSLTSPNGTTSNRIG